MIGKRGKLAALSTSLFALLPSNAPNSTALSVLRSTAAGHFRDWQVVWEAASGSRAEVLYDRYRLTADGVLSMFLVDGAELRVVDLELEL